MDGLAQERGVRDLVPIRGERRSFPEVERDDASVPPLWERQMRKRHDVVVGLDDAATSVVHARGPAPSVNDHHPISDDNDAAMEPTRGRKRPDALLHVGAEHAPARDKCPCDRRRGLQLDARKRLAPRQELIIEGHDVPFFQIGHVLRLRRQSEVVLDQRKRRHVAAARRQINNITVNVPEARRNLKECRHGLVVRRRHRRCILVCHTSNICIEPGRKSTRSV